jgi:uncharacterized membrane protein YphA (DoxX/SURF4 family)
MKDKIAESILFIVRLVLGTVFIASSISKLCQPYDFLANVYSYELVGPQISIAIAIVLPWLELFVGMCLVGGIFVAGALLASIGMCIMFSFVLASALWRGLEITCGCFNPSDTNIIGYWTLFRAVMLLFAAVSIYLYVVLRRVCSS